MLSRGCRPIGAKLPRQLRASPLSTSPVTHSHHPNAPLDLDPSFKALLKDVDMSLLRQKSRPSHILSHGGPSTPRQLELIPKETFDENSEDAWTDETEDQQLLSRKSPAALFGSQGIGAVQLPLELQDTISRLIAGQFHVYEQTFSNMHFQNLTSLCYMLMQNDCSNTKAPADGTLRTMSNINHTINRPAMQSGMALHLLLSHFPLITLSYIPFSVTSNTV